MAIKKEAIEALAELEHEQWVATSEGYARIFKEVLGLFSKNYMSNLPRIEQILREQIRKWEEGWIPYAELSDENKSADRALAERIMNALEKLSFELPEEE